MCLESFFCEAGLQCPTGLEGKEPIFDVAASMGYDRCGLNDKVQPRNVFELTVYAIIRQVCFRRYAVASRETAELRRGIRSDRKSTRLNSSH